MGSYDHFKVIFLKEFGCQGSAVEVGNSPDSICLPLFVIVVDGVTPKNITHDSLIWYLDVPLYFLESILITTILT